MNKYEVRIDFLAPVDMVKASNFKIDNNNVLVFYRHLDQDNLERVAVYKTWLSVKMISDE